MILRWWNKSKCSPSLWKKLKITFKARDYIPPSAVLAFILLEVLPAASCYSSDHSNLKQANRTVRVRSHEKRRNGSAQDRNNGNQKSHTNEKNSQKSSLLLLETCLSLPHDVCGGFPLSSVCWNTFSTQISSHLLSPIHFIYTHSQQLQPTPIFISLSAQSDPPSTNG